jgi:hypothetical protein
MGGGRGVRREFPGFIVPGFIVFQFTSVKPPSCKKSNTITIVNTVQWKFPRIPCSDCLSGNPHDRKGEGLIRVFILFQEPQMAQRL